MNGWMDEWMDGWMNGWTDGQIDRIDLILFPPLLNIHVYYPPLVYTFYFIKNAQYTRT